MLMLLCAVTTMWAQDLLQITSDESNPIYYTIYNTRSDSPGGLIYYAGDNAGLKDGCTATTLEDKYKFYFTGSDDALYVHNAATTKKLASVTSWTDEGTVWCVIRRNDGNLAFGPQEGDITSNVWWNEQNQGRDGYTVWNANDAGSGFVVELASEYVFPVTDRFYTIEAPLFENVQGIKKGLIVNADGSLGWNTIDLTNKNCYWIPAVNNDGTVALKNAGTGTYINGTAMSDAAVYATIKALGSNQFNIVVNETTINANGHSNGNASSGNIVAYGGFLGSASAWRFVERDDPDAIVEVSVNYKFTYNDEEKYTQTTTTIVGEEYPAITVVLPLGVTATQPSGVIDAADVKDGVITKVIDLSLDLPFEYADSYENITTWYYMNLRDDAPTYAYYDSSIGYIKATESSVPSDKRFEYAWAFIGDPFNGFSVVNHAAGETMVLSSPETPNGNQNAAQLPRMVEKDSATGNLVWDFVKPTHANVRAENGFYIQHPTAKDYAINRQSYNSAYTLCYWNGRDTGSTFQVVECDLTGLTDLLALIDQVDAAVAAYGKGGTTVGYYTAETVVALNEALVAAKNAASANESAAANATAQSALQAAVASLATIQPEEGKFYNIVSHCTDDHRANQQVYVNNAGGMQFANTADALSSPIGHVFQFVPAGKDKFYIYNVERGVYMNKVGEATTTETSGAKAVTISNMGVENVVSIKPDGESQMHAQDYGSKIVGWNNNSATNGSAWTIVEVENIAELGRSVTVGEAGYATLCLGYNATIPAGVEAYAVSSTNSTHAIMTQINGAIPANEAVILKLAEDASAGTFNFVYAESADDVENNLLMGTTVDTYIAGPAYVLGVVGEAVGLYKALLNADATGAATGETHFKNNAHKAYLPATAGANLTAAFYGFNFGGTTGIDQITDNREQSTVIYDLQGRRVSEITEKGIYIVGGKKVLVK